MLLSTGGCEPALERLVSNGTPSIDHCDSVCQCCHLTRPHRYLRLSIFKHVLANTEKLQLDFSREVAYPFAVHCEVKVAFHSNNADSRY